MGYIKEIQGLRAVAALLVAIYHIWLNRVSGGVDAFFVIAAFFLMSSFAKTGQPHGGDVLRYYAATVRRVVPLAVIVILATIGGSILIFHPLEWGETHALASAVFAENWWLAWVGTDYLRRDLSVSPFQQMWALSLQMQYYLVLPLTLWAVAALATRTRFAVRSAWTATLLVLLVLSFAYNLHITAANQPWAYFDSFARGWEYMAGALLALHIGHVPRLSRGVARALGYSCLLVLVGFAAVIPVAGTFPGTAALVPVLSTLGLIVAARAGANIEPLTNRPILALGEISFALYLWHWPLLIFWRHWTGETAVGLAPGLGIILLAGALAFLTFRFLELPFRRWPRLVARPVLSLIVSAVFMAPVLVAIYLWVDWSRAQVREANALMAAFTADPQAWSEDRGIIPPLLVARNDIPRPFMDGCHQATNAAPLIECTYGKEDAGRTLVLVGGSHSLQWFPALERLSAGLDFRIINMTKSACIFLDSDDERSFMATAEEFNFDSPRSCLEWNKAAEARIVEIAPDLVLTVGTRGIGPEERILEGCKSLWADLAAAGIPVLALRDTPWFPMDVPRCVAREIEAPSACNQPRAALLSPADLGQGLDIPGVTFADLSDLICDAATCQVVRNGLLVYRDDQHLTSTYVRVHADRLGDEITAVIGRPGFGHPRTLPAEQAL